MGFGTTFRDKLEKISLWSPVRSPHSTSEALPASGTLLAAYELVWPTEEDLARPVLPKLTAKLTLDRDGLKRKFLPPGGHIAAALLAGDHEGFAARGGWEHGDIIGEHEAKMMAGESVALPSDKEARFPLPITWPVTKTVTIFELQSGSKRLA